MVHNAYRSNTTTVVNVVNSQASVLTILTLVLLPAPGTADCKATIPGNGNITVSLAGELVTALATSLTLTL
jgi:hypothetical protein